MADCHTWGNRWLQPPYCFPPGLRQQEQHGVGEFCWICWIVVVIARHGVPSRIRTDRGENVDICMAMNIFRGTRRGSAIQGRSVHNQRIERLWGDMWRGLTNVYHRLFNFLESEGVIEAEQRFGRLYQSVEPLWIEDRKIQQPAATLWQRMSPAAGTTVNCYAEYHPVPFINALFCSDAFDLK
ncbi:hypothetical protein N1851_031719 [Merluccius polli]|uniref:Integrase core domain-containing protein n=1 Tax=Merluccius polli TaxID=89951 RepID=A0AA47M3G4_MERPO|nr:hypothetical protein N1851_031719 [Merluccius polli]